MAAGVGVTVTLRGSTVTAHGSTVTWFRYVALHEVAQWLALGWELADDMAGTHHGHYSVLMSYTGEDAPPVPCMKQ